VLKFALIEWLSGISGKVEARMLSELKMVKGNHGVSLGALVKSMVGTEVEEVACCGRTNSCEAIGEQRRCLLTVLYKLLSLKVPASLPTGKNPVPTQCLVYGCLWRESVL
jgi:hypothetical protein